MNNYLRGVASIIAPWPLLVGCYWLTLCGLLDGMSDTITYSVSAAFLDLKVLIWIMPRSSRKVHDDIWKEHRVTPVADVGHSSSNHKNGCRGCEHVFGSIRHF